MSSPLVVLERDVSFEKALESHGLAPLCRTQLTTLQVNLGKRCNQACHHCHVEAGPKRTEMMPRGVAEAVVDLLARSPSIATLDLTGGAPELNENFRWLVRKGCELGREVIDRCNLTILHEPGQEDLAEFWAGLGVRIIASMPCYSAENVDRQRGRGVFDKSIEALKKLNALGYGEPGSGRVLDLVYNPLGPSLPPEQANLEQRYKHELYDAFGIRFNGLLTLANMVISRFANQLRRDGRLQDYRCVLTQHFNPETVPHVMCRGLLSVGHDGRLYDCDFNQMLELPLGAGVRSVGELTNLDSIDGAPIAIGEHCFACTAGAGSSCGGALQ